MNDDSPPGDGTAPHDESSAPSSPEGPAEQDDTPPSEPNASVNDPWARFEPPKIELPEVELPMFELPTFEIPDQILRGFQFDTSHLQSVMAKALEGIASQIDTSVFQYQLHPKLLRAITGPALSDEFMKGWAGVVERLVEPLRELGKISMPSVPANWPLDRMPSLSRLVELAFEYGIPIIWVPSGDVVVALAAAEDPDLALVEAAATILKDCRAVAAECDHPALATAVAMLCEAIDVAEDGKWLAAQAAATMVCEYLWVGSDADLIVLGDVYPRPPDDPMKITIRMLRPMFIVNSAEQAWKQFWVKNGDDVPKRYNRHASTHTLDEDQYTTRNALVGVMLAASLMREIQELVAPAAKDQDAA